jgi:hypothetical protein
MKILLAALVMTAVFFYCKLVNEEGETYTIKMLKIEDGEVSGWNASSYKGFVQFNTSNMEELVNGGSDQYIPKGLVEGFEQNMEKEGTERTYQSWTVDFGTPEKAANMFNIKALANPTMEPATEFATTEAFLVSDTYGYQGFANFGKYYVWMKFDNFGSNKSEAKNNLLGFLKVVKAKINGLK